MFLLSPFTLTLQLQLDDPLLAPAPLLPGVVVVSELLHATNVAPTVSTRKPKFFIGAEGTTCSRSIDRSFHTLR